MSRFPKLSEMKHGDLFGLGTVAADILESFGIEDADLPDIVPADIDYGDPDELARYFPAVYQKVSTIAAGWDE